MGTRKCNLGIEYRGNWLDMMFRYTADQCHLDSAVQGTSIHRCMDSIFLHFHTNLAHSCSRGMDESLEPLMALM
jgi:hypothetical protein|eukprot:scaffold1576_cov192-Alexandrium_tamarense.AAC.8